MTKGPFIGNAISLLGKRVKVTLDKANNKEEAVITEGQLLGVGDEGTFEILLDDGFVHYCWPMLEIKEVPPGA